MLGLGHHGTLAKIIEAVATKTSPSIMTLTLREGRDCPTVDNYPQLPDGGTVPAQQSRRGGGVQREGELTALALAALSSTAARVGSTPDRLA